MKFLSDKKNQAALAGAVAAVLVQFLHSKGVDWIDATTANTLTLAIIGLAVGLMGSHAGVEASENHADALTQAAETHAASALDVAKANAAKAP